MKIFEQKGAAYTLVFTVITLVLVLRHWTIKKPLYNYKELQMIVVAGSTVISSDRKCTTK